MFLNTYAEKRRNSI